MCFKSFRTWGTGAKADIVFWPPAMARISQLSGVRSPRLSVCRWARDTAGMSWKWRVKQFNCSPKPGWAPRTSTGWRGETLRYHSNHITSVCVSEGVHDRASAWLLCVRTSVHVLHWLHAGCWKQTDRTAWCHGNLQRSSLSLVFSSTVGAYRSDITGYTLYSKPGCAPS